MSQVIHCVTIMAQGHGGRVETSSIPEISKTGQQELVISLSLNLAL
ncbi:mCG147015 [Mus musculus]|nr:mCG147015 [Mus musculus]